jgi:anti-sigma factor RsiW
VSAPPPEEMACREVVEVITDYLEGTLPADARDRFEAHLAECPYCITYLEQMRATIEALGELQEESLDDQTRDGLVEAFRGWNEARRPEDTPS